MNCRHANSTDIPLLVDLRKKQLIDEGCDPAINIDQDLTIFFTNYLQSKILVQLLIEDKQQLVATAGIIFYQFPPSFTNQSGWRGYITNVYTADAYRGKGFAKELLTKLVAEAKGRQVYDLWLGASEMGRPVYKKFGFKETDVWLELSI